MSTFYCKLCAYVVARLRETSSRLALTMILTYIAAQLKMHATIDWNYVCGEIIGLVVFILTPERSSGSARATDTVIPDQPKDTPS